MLAVAMFISLVEFGHSFNSPIKAMMPDQSIESTGGGPFCGT